MTSQRVISRWDKLSGRERQIMEIVYARKHATAKQVWTALADPPSHTAVRTLVRILEEKGYLTHKKREGREFVFQPTRPRGPVARSALRRVLDTFFDGSLEKALAVHLTGPVGLDRLTDEELKRLADLIKAARRKST